MKSKFFLLLCLLIFVAPFGLTSCGDLDTEPSIVSVTITPDSIPESATGMTDELFTITIETSNFSAPIESAVVEIQELEREAEPEAGSTKINGDTVTFTTKKSWFSGADVGVYRIRATVVSEGNADRVSQGNAATVEVTN